MRRRPSMTCCSTPFIARDLLSFLRHARHRSLSGLANGMQLAFYIGRPADRWHSGRHGGVCQRRCVRADWIGADDKLLEGCARCTARIAADCAMRWCCRTGNSTRRWGRRNLLGESSAATRIKFAHPSTKLPAGTKPAFLRKPATTQPQ